jgi:hypothetical protein
MICGASSRDFSRCILKRSVFAHCINPILKPDSLPTNSDYKPSNNMLSKVLRILQVFLPMLLLTVKLFSEIPQKVETSSKITPEQMLTQLSEEDKISLTQFFRLMLLQSQGGYVLGVKPICLDPIDTVTSPFCSVTLKLTAHQ